MMLYLLTIVKEILQTKHNRLCINRCLTSQFWYDLLTLMLRYALSPFPRTRPVTMFFGIRYTPIMPCVNTEEPKKPNEPMNCTKLSHLFTNIVLYSNTYSQLGFNYFYPYIYVLYIPYWQMISDKILHTM